MKSLIQNLNNGKVTLIETEIPKPKENQILIKTNKTLISTGTEKMLIEFGKSNLIKKVQGNKDKVNQVLEKFKTIGIKDTLKIVNEKLNTPIQIGYSNVGVVQVSNCKDFKPGDRVVSNSFHSEYCIVEKNLCTKIPNNVNDTNAIFSILASIALNGVRKCNTQINENIIIYGFGLIGIITAKLLENLGVNIIIIDNDENKRKIAEDCGYSFFNPSQEELKQNINRLTNNQGADSIIICTYTKSNEPIIESSKIIRKKGKIIIIGICGLDLSRDLLYEKEAELQISKSYGPGRYEYAYEKLGLDLPFEHVRWTQKRNIESILNLISKKKINFEDLIEEEFDVDNYVKAYEKIENQKSLKGILLNFENLKVKDQIKPIIKVNDTNEGEITLDCIGAGNHCKRILLPAFKKMNVDFSDICGDSTIKSEIIKKKFSFEKVVSDEDQIFKNKKNSFIIISTPHHLHSNQIIKAIKNNKPIFIEKPMAVDNQQLKNIKEVINDVKNIPPIHINFNRRYSFFGKKMKSLLNKSNKKTISIDINSPPYTKEGSWLEDNKKSGGPIVGEACHFIDFSKFLINEKISKYELIKNNHNNDFEIYLEFEDGSISKINYYFSGNKKFSKENIKVFSGNCITIIDDFKKIKHYGKTNYSKNLFFGQDKGHSESINIFMKKIKEKKYKVQELFDYIDTTKISIDLAENC